ncbi:vanillyl-alcohol oxidase [Jaapia argillacea MUCL 33604]|uniref:Vanillyl-alcohol oxidase n=1 Tax=Jaapia argillacea MUCL 33604 TaxID=933084 RepID=A0A067PUR8_9AGAM|nr:vanillyl-alcohol oxidase [Jaapia argillacea MUCL 33604]
MASVDLTSIPLLDKKHSGVPSDYLEQAKGSKARLYSNKTLPASVPRDEEVPVLPPDVTREIFDAAIAELKRKLGEENVELNDKPLVDGWYLEHPNTHDAFHVVPQSDLVSSATVYPGSTDEVVQIVRWANDYLIPIYPISMGRNLGYGGAAPRVRGSVVVDLGRRMNKVLKIDGSNATCMVEPGVSYFKLHEEVQKTGYDLWVDVPDVAGGSVLGNAIDRGVGYTPYGDHFTNHCGLEVVLPSGEVLRTGMGALPGKDGADNPSWQAFQNPYGPTPDGIFSQSNFGIVTKMGMWLMPATGHQSYMITFPRDDDFEQIIEIIRPLALNRILGNIPQLRSVIQELAVTGKPKSFFYDGKDPMPREVVRSHAKNMPCGDISWAFYGTVYGNKETRDMQLEIIKREFGKVAGARFILPEEMPPEHYIHSRVNVCSGTPELRELDWLNWQPNAAHLFFAPITPTRGEDARVIHEIVSRLHKKWGFDNFSTLCIAGREMHWIANIVYDRADEDSKRRAVGLMREMIEEAAKNGFGEYRTHLLFADQVARTYGWNNQALMRFNETIKDALDPNGILAPGRAGIWPRRFRGKGWEILEEDEWRNSSLPKVDGSSK